MVVNGYPHPWSWHLVDRQLLVDNDVLWVFTEETIMTIKIALWWIGEIRDNHQMFGLDKNITNSIPIDWRGFNAKGGKTYQHYVSKIIGAILLYIVMLRVFYQFLWIRVIWWLAVIRVDSPVLRHQHIDRRIGPKHMSVVPYRLICNNPKYLVSPPVDPHTKMRLRENSAFMWHKKSAGASIIHGPPWCHCVLCIWEQNGDDTFICVLNDIMDHIYWFAAYKSAF